MKPAAFDYIRAETLAEVHATLATEGEQARVIAGGQTLVPMLSMRLARPNVVLDIMRLSELGGIWLERDSIEHRKAVHPDQPIMTYVEFFRERQQARYAVSKGRFRGCC